MTGRGSHYLVLKKVPDNPISTTAYVYCIPFCLTIVLGETLAEEGSTLFQANSHCQIPVFASGPIILPLTLA